MPRPRKQNESSRDWLALRRDFEGGQLGARKFAQLRGIPVQTVQSRILREGWKRNAVLVRQTANQLQSAIQAKVKAHIENELAPFIEAEKEKFTRRGIKLAKRGLVRVEKFFKANPAVDAKNDSMIAKAGETWHRVGRTALGMSDGTTAVAPLNLAILGGHTAVQIVHSQPGESSPGADPESQD